MALGRGSRTGFVLRRLVSVVPVLFGVVVVVFLLTRLLPGDPAAFFTAAPGVGAEELDEVRRELGLDRSLPEQFVLYIDGLAHGDLGESLVTGQPVARDLIHRLPASMELTMAAMLLTAAIAVPLGIVAALRPGSLTDHLCRLMGTAGLSMPIFVTGLLLIYLFYFLLGWAPDPIGRLDPFLRPPPRITGFLVIDSLIAGDLEALVASLKQLALPAAAMAIFSIAPIARMTRASMLSVLASDFIRAARSLGLSRRQILVAYALRNAILPVITLIGMVASYMLGANVLVEKVFAWPGVGSYALDALVSLDYAPIQGYVLLLAAIYVLLNLAIDILYGFVDPRVTLDA